LTLFAEIPAAGWTDNEVLITLGIAAAGLSALFLFLLRYLVSREKGVQRKAEKQRDELKNRVRELEQVPTGGPQPDPHLTDTQRELPEGRVETDDLRAELSARTAAANAREATLEKQAAELKGALAAAQADLKAHESGLAAERRRIQRALQSREGK